MKRVPVESSMIAEVGYDAEKHTLEVMFHSGQIFEYYDVPAEQYTSMLAAKSAGQYFNQNFKGQFVYKHIKERQEAAFVRQVIVGMVGLEFLPEEAEQLHATIREHTKARRSPNAASEAKA